MVTALAFCMNVAGIPAYAIDNVALPQGGTITAGEGAISRSGANMTIDQYTDRMIADWASFDIGADAAVAFNQPDASSIALNRIHNGSPSRIFGKLTSNGRIFLLNSAGIIFGESAQVDVGGLVASSLNISNDDFMSGIYAFEKDGASGAVVNFGNIRANGGGFIVFMGPQVKNEGTIETSSGYAALLSGDKISLDFTGDNLINFNVDKGTIDALVENKGMIKVNEGVAVLTAKAADTVADSVVNNSGVIEAKGIAVKGGRIILDSGENGRTGISGKLDASSDLSAGGKIVATGERVLIGEGSHLSAAGATGGGEILVGGGWQGTDPDIRSATGVAILEGATLDASAIDNGAGGTIVVWSDVNDPGSVTRVYGSLISSGGINGGDGGNIETSGHWLDINVAPDVSSFVGKGGLWLIDPYNISVVGGGGRTNINNSSPFQSSGDNASLGVNLINSALNSGDVIVQTGAGGAQGGDIFWNVDYTYSGGGERTLTLNAHRDLILNQTIASSSGALNLVFNANYDDTGPGGTVVKENLSTLGGDITFNGVGAIFNGSLAQALNTSGGNIFFNGEVLLSNTNGLTLNTNNGNVIFSDVINSGNSYVYQSAGKAWTMASSLVAAGGYKIGDGSSIGDQYLATVTSSLETTAVMAASGGNQAWLGGSDTQTEGTWRWVSGPEGLENGGSGRIFWIAGQQAQGSTGYTGYNGQYVNWNGGEPNDSGSNEDALQMGFSTGGLWNDLPVGNSLGSIVETNLAASPLTINAGAGNVTLSGAVGSSKALASLDITGAVIAVDGGAVTTQGLQTYNGDVTLGASDTILTQTNAATDFTVTANKSITNAAGADASLIIKTTRSIIMDTDS